MAESPPYTPWSELSALARARIRMKYWAQQWLFDWDNAPVRHGDRGYASLVLWSGGGRLSHWKASWWIVVPVLLRRRYTHWFNLRNCRRHGHDDFLWHFEKSPPDLPDGKRFRALEPRCNDCSTLLTGCTGVGSWHDRREATEGREERV